MNCSKIKRVLEEYIDGSLSEKKRVEFENHLRNCADCKACVQERQRLGGMLSGSLKKMADNRELSPKTVKSVLGIAGKSRQKRTPPLILRPSFAVYAILPLLILGLFFVVFHFKNGKNHGSDSIGQEAVSYLKLITTHYKDTSSDEWIVKRTHIKRSNGQEGFLTLEITRELKESKGE